jgi:glucose-6-phosphate isomerase
VNQESDRMPYAHRIDRCVTEGIGSGGGSGRGSGGLDRGAVAALQQATEAGIDALAAAKRDNTLPLLNLPERHDDIAHLTPIARDFRERFDDVIVLGTGGSSLGGKTLVALADRGFGPASGAPRLHFMDNVDPVSFADLEAATDPTRTGLIVISKSGSTAETLTQFLVLLPRLRDALGLDDVGGALIAITEPRDNPLRRLAERIGATVIDHDPGIGGRYSVLSPVGLLPALIAGLDAAAVRRGAARVWRGLIEQRGEAAPAVGAALAVAAMRAGLTQTVLMPYVDRLGEFGLWFRQLWAESLGKDGHGTTPIRALGTVDQHSQLQLYLAGPSDKLYTLITAPSVGVGRVVDRALADDSSLSYLVGHSLGDLLDAEARATYETLARNGRPTRLIALDRLDEEGLGALFMHFMLETILTAHLIGVDPFDQPAVEEGKVLARKYLAGEA